MGIIAVKFGGTSAADAEGFRRIADVVAARRGRQYIVLSAPGKRFPGDEKVTDLLYHARTQYENGENPQAILEKVCVRFEEIAGSLHLNVDACSLREALLTAVQTSRAAAISRGEYFCAKLFAEYTNLPFADAADLIRFDRFGRLSEDATRAAVRAMAKRFSSAVIPGFYGSLPDGSIRTFPRGGSDITGALIAAALDADLYENRTDVDGLMSADPAVCPDAVVHSAVSYRQMSAIASSGAQVLHPCCLEPVRRAGIPTILRSTFRNTPGTYISDAVRTVVPCICALGSRTAVPLDFLTSESQQLACTLGEIYPQPSGAGLVILPASAQLPGIPVSIVSVFGLPNDLYNEAKHIVQPLSVLSDELCIRYLVPAEKEKSAQQALHALVSGKVRDSRTL